jgi:hypothetical protein
VRVHPGQTLILAGEALPRRSAAGQNLGSTSLSGRSSSNAINPQRLGIISAHLDALVTDAEYTATSSVTQPTAVAYDIGDVDDATDEAGLPATATRPSSLATSRAYSWYASSSRGGFGGASAYARTQDLSDRHPIIDTYA